MLNFSLGVSLSYGMHELWEGRYVRKQCILVGHFALSSVQLPVPHATNASILGTNGCYVAVSMNHSAGWSLLSQDVTTASAASAAATAAALATTNELVALVTAGMPDAAQV